MPEQVKLWRVGDGDHLEPVHPEALDFEQRLEAWIANDITILQSDLLVVGRQVSTDYGGVIDLLCLDQHGDCVLVELKRALTPREVTAQTLDDASWVSGLSGERIVEIANAYLGDDGPLEEAFSRRFRVELPQVLTAEHGVIVVGSQIDASTERIIRYLSDVHGVGINAVTFQHFRTAPGDELVSRLVLMEQFVAPPGQPLAAFVCPGHPLLDATLDLTLERHRDVLGRGTVLVDENDPGTTPRVLFYLEHAVQDARVTASADRRTISRRMLYVELGPDGAAQHLQYAPYLDYRPLTEGDPGIEALLARPECDWIDLALEHRAQAHAIAHVVPEHLAEVRGRRLEWVTKTRAAVKDRLTNEINYWDHRSADLAAQEQAGKPNARLNSQEARRRADELQARLEKRLDELELEAQVSALPPVVIGGLVVVPLGLLAPILAPGTEQRRHVAEQITALVDRQAVAARARVIVMDVERGLGFDPVDVESDKVGYDILSRDPRPDGHSRFLEVKGRVSGAATITVTKNEVLYSLNEPDHHILECIADGTHQEHYVRRPFRREPDFGVTSVNYDLAALIAQGDPPR